MGYFRMFSPLRLGHLFWLLLLPDGAPSQHKTNILKRNQDQDAQRREGPDASPWPPDTLANTHQGFHQGCCQRHRVPRPVRLFYHPRFIFPRFSTIFPSLAVLDRDIAATSIEPVDWVQEWSFEKSRDSGAILQQIFLKTNQRVLRVQLSPPPPGPAIV